MALTAKTILFAWELGEGLGHLPALKAIALAAKAEGARVVFALREPAPSRAALVEIGAQVLQAPFWPAPALPAKPSGSYADLIAANGFASVANAQSLIGDWDKLFDTVKPDLIVCEHAPGAAVAAFGRIPVAVVGNGFVVPPADGATFPPFEVGRGDAALQGAVLDVVREALTSLGRRAPAELCEPFRGVFRGVFAFPALDPYRGRRLEAVLGPVEPMPALRPLHATRKLFAYSAADAAMIEPMTLAFMTLGPRASVYLRGSLGARAAVLRSRGVTVHETAPSLAVVLPEMSAVFSHGGSGFTHAALAAGRPHIVYPRHGEAYYTARALVEMGAGIVLNPFDPKRFAEAVVRANEDVALRDAAQKAGAGAQNFLRDAKPIETAIVALRRALASAGGL
ncbi:MAG: glycosyltransferase [Micropepsaceae bacterium]